MLSCVVVWDQGSCSSEMQIFCLLKIYRGGERTGHFVRAMSGVLIPASLRNTQMRNLDGSKEKI